MKRSASAAVFVFAGLAFWSSCSKDPVSPPDAAFDAGAVDSMNVDASSEVALGTSIDVGASEADSAVMDAPVEGGPPLAGSCNANSDCAATYLCIDGVCAPSASFCGEGTKCITNCRSPGLYPHPGSQCLGGWVRACVNGICAARCSHPSLVGDPPGCPVGYACDKGRDVCILNPTPCVGSGASSCQAGSVCVEERCVPACTAPDRTQGTCPADTLCINGGCLSIEQAGFECQNDGDTKGCQQVPMFPSPLRLELRRYLKSNDLWQCWRHMPGADHRLRPFSDRGLRHC